MIETIKELFTAHYDPETNTIHNCKKGSFAYFHEQRHKQQMENKIVYWIHYASHLFSFVFASFFITIGFFWGFFKAGLMLAGISIIPYITITAFLEMDAWGYTIFFKNSEMKR